MDRAEALEQIREKEGENAGPDHVFAGYHCQDCIYWERVNGKGRCQLISTKG